MFLTNLFQAFENDPNCPSSPKINVLTKSDAISSCASNFGFGLDLDVEFTEKLGFKPNSLDYKLYPTIVVDDKRRQFVAVLQDRDAPIDMGTPTCHHMAVKRLLRHSDLKGAYWNVGGSEINLLMSNIA